MPSYPDLAALRERMFGFSRAFVAREVQLDAKRLARIEGGDAPTVAELERLSELYGIDAGALSELPVEVSPEDGITALALLDEFKEVSPVTKRCLLSAARAARHVVELRALLLRPRGYDALLARHHPAPPRKGLPPYAQGASCARAWRREIGLSQRPVRSTRDLVQNAFPEIAVLITDLGSDAISGVSFADVARGPTIVLNSRGKNENPLVRRFSLLHELAHLLLDARRGEPLATISGFLIDAQLDVEQRANAFAVRFLCPEAKLREVAEQATPEHAADELLRRWGLHYGAAALYLRNVAGKDVPEGPTDAHLASSVLPCWFEAEDWGEARFPLPEVPLERRTDVARLAARAYSQGKLGRDRFARYLGVTPLSPVERVLDYFGLDQAPDRYAHPV